MLALYRPTVSDMLYDPFKIFDVFSTNHSRVASDIEYTDEAARLQLELPGIKKSDLEVNVVGDVLYISGKRKGTEFKRSYSIDESYDPETTDAILEDGILTIMIASHPKVKPKKIEVKVR